MTRRVMRVPIPSPPDDTDENYYLVLRENWSLKWPSRCSVLANKPHVRAGNHWDGYKAHRVYCFSPASESKLTTRLSLRVPFGVSRSAGFHAQMVHRKKLWSIFRKGLFPSSSRYTTRFFARSTSQPWGLHPETLDPHGTAAVLSSHNSNGHHEQIVWKYVIQYDYNWSKRDEHYGFRHKHSTSLQLVLLV
jgi:hypothetical protein